MSSNHDFLFDTALPAMGNLTSLALFGASWKDVAKIKRNRHCGALNGIPFVACLLQGVMWAVYGVFMRTLSIVPINIIGCTCMLYYSVIFYSVIPYDRKILRTVFEVGIVFAIIAPFTLAALLFFAVEDNDARISVYGIITNCCSVAFYVSPFSALYGIIKSRDASPISKPLAVTVLMNGTLWFFYGFHRNDWNICTPNMFAVVLSIIQLIIRKYYGVAINVGELEEPTTTAPDFGGDVPLPVKKPVELVIEGASLDSEIDMTPTVQFAPHVAPVDFHQRPVAAALVAST